GGKTVLLKTLPPRWRCICPDGKKRHRIGPHAFVCKGKPGGDGGGGNPKKDCLKKGWYWIGGVCLPKIGKCKKGYVGKWPNCKKLGFEPKKCKPGYVGKWPNCTKLEIHPKKKCKPGYVGTWPNCTKLGLKKPDKHKPNKKLDDLKKAFKTFKLQKKD
ncbi:MAG TPA: hypothetical protein VGA65_01005, partial [Hyphomicrobium sp.]